MRIAQVGSLEFTVIDLILHAKSRCGIGFGSYPAGLHYAIHQVLPFVDQDAGTTNGLGEPFTIRRLVADLDSKVEEG